MPIARLPSRYDTWCEVALEVWHDTEGNGFVQGVIVRVSSSDSPPIHLVSESHGYIDADTLSDQICRHNIDNLTVLGFIECVCMRLERFSGYYWGVEAEFEDMEFVGITWDSEDPQQRALPEPFPSVDICDFEPRRSSFLSHFTETLAPYSGESKDCLACRSKNPTSCCYACGAPKCVNCVENDFSFDMNHVRVIRYRCVHWDCIVVVYVITHVPYGYYEALTYSSMCALRAHAIKNISQGHVIRLR